MQYLPIFLNTVRKPCLVIGGGPVAARKIDSLLRASADVQVVSPQVSKEIEQLAQQGHLSVIRRTYEARDLEGMTLAIAATDDELLNRTISADAGAKNIPVNVVDNPSLCSFIMPSIVDRSPVIIAVSTGGSAPVLARYLRARLETLVPATFGQLADLMKNARARVKDKFPRAKQRRRFWESVVYGPIAEQIFEGKKSLALATLEQAIDSTEAISADGEVYLVGAGPGDPDLLTFRALRLMQQADVVVYDRLVAPALVDLCRKDADRIYVGKQRAQHAYTQNEINDLLTRLAMAGKRVVRLKGGDPFIFGRGGEEIETLAKHGVNFQIVPGITAASGCAAYAGIPLTHRDFAQQCIFVTGHMKDGKLNLPWTVLVQPQQTIAIYMGLHSLAELSLQLVDAGMAPTMPAAIVESGTTPDQRVTVSTVGELIDLVEQRTFRSPAMILIGEVVTLRNKFTWFD